MTIRKEGKRHLHNGMCSRLEPRALRSPLRPAEGKHHEQRPCACFQSCEHKAALLPFVPALSPLPSLTRTYTRSLGSAIASWWHGVYHWGSARAFRFRCVVGRRHGAAWILLGGAVGCVFAVAGVGVSGEFLLAGGFRWPLGFYCYTGFACHDVLWGGGRWC
jgi:hypothetical protein